MTGLPQPGPKLPGHKLPGLTFAALALSVTLASCTMMTGPRASTNLVDPNGKAVGTATFGSEGGSTRVKVTVSGLTPGQHGMHIHVNPSCTNTTDDSGNPVIFGGAGGHFDPGNAGKHGSPDMPDTAGHGGDMPMITANADGTGSADFLTTKVSLSGNDSVIGHSIVIHADPDDYQTDPAGNSGARVVCGVIN